jgi:hypothetical protein
MFTLSPINCSQLTPFQLSCAQKEDTTFSISLSSESWSTNPQLREAVNHSQTCTYNYQRKTNIWRSPLRALDGERCGPLITMDDIQECMANGRTLDDHIAGLDCTYDSDLLFALIKMDETATERAAANQEKEKEERGKRVKRFRILKAEKLEEVLGKIQAILDPRWKDFALRKYYFSSDGWSRFRDFQGEYSHYSTIAITTQVLQPFAHP